MRVAPRGSPKSAEEIHLHGRGGLAQGAVMAEIFERFCDAEFSADWDATLARFGDAACYSLMPRSDAQRRFDALYAIFERAAATAPDATAAVPLVNLVIDVPTLERLPRRHPATAPCQPIPASGAAKPSAGSRSHPPTSWRR